jgi:hypothetical protein
MLGQRVEESATFVEGYGERQLTDRLRYARGAGQAEGCESRAGLGEEAVAVAVVATLELEDQIAAGEGTGEPDGGHGCLGAAIDEADYLDRRHEGDELLGQLDFFRRGRTVMRPLANGALDGLGHLRVGMTKDQRPP